ncbi:LysR family transcriptional regulator [Vibrio sp. dhg]|uniref:LysR family transcriptional regulator n=1 Tax=Vibrio sp. dhg TaxID=2163016 RepID=UPI000E479FEC|nr:LysR family transcriptional regulator [Vibrio sp. dhg]AXT70734.1 LysR family transcriptional regulator [Vibrio sp. dhg]
MNKNNNGLFDLNLLRVFLALYDEGSASRAAVRLSVTQSAVSAALKRLRLIYDDQLFIRNSQGLLPTSKAHAIKPIIADSLDNFLSTLNHLSESELNYANQSIIIGLSDDFELSIGPLLAEKIKSKYPMLKVVFRQTNSQKVINAIVERQIDIAITSSYLHSSSIHSDLIAYGNYSCLVSNDFVFTETKETLSLETYLASNHLLVSGDGLTGIVDDILSRNGQKRNISMATTHFSALPFLLKGPRTLATVPSHAAKAISHVCGLVNLPCPLKFDNYPVSVSWHKIRAKDSLILEVINSVKEAFSESSLDLSFSTTDKLDQGSTKHQ